MGFSRSNEAPSTPRIECEDCSQVPYNNNNNSEIDLGRGWKKKRKKKSHARPFLVLLTDGWWQRVSDGSVLTHSRSEAGAVSITADLYSQYSEPREDKSSSNSRTVSGPAAFWNLLQSLETSMACADMFTELELGVTGKRFPIKYFAWHKSQQEERLSTPQLTETLSVLSCCADVLTVSSDCLRDPKLDWLIKGRQSLPLRPCARKVH